MAFNVSPKLCIVAEDVALSVGSSAQGPNAKGRVEPTYNAKWQPAPALPVWHERVRRNLNGA